MGFFDQLLAGGVQGLAQGLGSFAKDLRTAITGEAPIDPNKRAELLVQIQALEAASIQAAADFDKAQMQGAVDVAKIEAASADKFVSRWRPFIGWTCGLGLCIQFVLGPVGAFVATQVTGQPQTFPALNVELLITLVFGMLGLGTMRTFEKIRGATK